ncbi:MAG: molybdopterin-dependent oxidoreductase [Actinobacteria bacterium]|jgi:trimethylamine-N-oxide reductase (cytochrome c)|nr:molybdopterin-dependent oxidoreductase [Actinomycetota bacterium]
MAERVFANCTNSGPVSVYVKDGKIVRVRPLVVDEKDFKPWTIEAGGKEYSPPKKVTLSPYTHAERRRIYSDERIKYPMKRVDFDANGAPGSTGPGGRNPQNRGRSPYEHISWDEAATLVSSELTRVKDAYGGSAISGMTSSHHNWGIVGYKMGPFARFLNMMEGTPVLDNPDSWEGWHWGATHSYGFYWRLGMPEPYDMLGDALQNAEMIVYWSNDPDSTRGTYSGQDSALWRQWLKEKGVKMVFIDPFYNYTNAVMGGKWITPRMGTDAAMAMAIAFVWITEDTYNKEYVADRTIGFEEFKEYILGDIDGVPKTPEWAAEECDVEARVIRALAREWAAKRTILSGGSRGGEGGACREAYGTEWARMMVLLQAMQGLGAPGRSIWGTTMGAPNDTTVWVPAYGEPNGRISMSPKVADYIPVNSNPQRLWRLTVPDAILDPPVEWYGEGFCGRSLEQQFMHFKYPAEGCSEVKLWYRYGGSFMGTMSDTTKWARMYQSPKLEFVVNQDIWWNSETRMADVILPACTNFERDDIGEWAAVNGYTWHASSGCNYRVVVREQKCIEPLWDSKSDYEIFALIFEKMGLRDEYTDGGKTEVDWVKGFFDACDLPKEVSWEEFNRKGYHIINIKDDYEPTPGLRWFYEGRACDTPDVGNPKRLTAANHELGTFSGKIEFASESLKQYFPDDEERPVVPRYLRSWEGYRTPGLYDKYPLQLLSPHPRFSFHCHYDKHTDWLNDIPVHRIKKDGYPWWPARLNPEDAAERGINSGDIVRLYNDRASVLCIAVVTGRVRPGTVHSYASSALYDPLMPGDPDSPDRGGCVSMLTPSRMLSKNAPGMTPNSCLIEIGKWEG